MNVFAAFVALRGGGGVGRGGRGQTFVLTVFISNGNLPTLRGTKLQRQLHEDYRRLQCM